MNLYDTDKNNIIELIKAGEKLPKEYIYKLFIEDGQIFKVEKDKNGIITKTILTKDWQDWIDYWTIDFNYEDKKEIIKIKNEEGETAEQWTGNYLFENEW